MRCRMPTSGSTMAAPRQGTSSVSGRRCSRCSLIVRRLQGLLFSKPGDELRAPSGSWLSRDPEGAFYHRPGSATALSAWLPGVRAVAEVGVAEAVVVLQAGADEPVQADVGEPDQGQGHDEAVGLPVADAEHDGRQERSVREVVQVRAGA